VSARRAVWLDCSFGASGDMLLGALAAAGAEVSAAVSAAVAGLGLGLGVRTEPVRRAGLAALRAHVTVPAGAPPLRLLADIEAVLDGADLPGEVRERSRRVFRVLADAEGAVHGIPPGEVHFHEVGALDSLADVVGVCAGLVALAAAAVSASPPALGGGTVGSEHGPLPVPAPAVLELARRHRIPTAAAPYPDAGELLTPTAAALLAVWATHFGPMPALLVDSVGVGAGSRDPAGGANVARVVVGSVAAEDGAQGAPVQCECTVDDADPRLWPGVLEALLAAGALDAWLTPVLMKKGRPGHVLTALAPPGLLPAVRAVMLRETTTLGIREITLRDRPALARREVSVECGGVAVRVKLALDDSGAVDQATPEWADVAEAARRSGEPARIVLARAQAAAAGWLGRRP
jgi:uncharacterized protein (TIGR00299 family) protein